MIITSVAIRRLHGGACRQTSRADPDHGHGYGIRGVLQTSGPRIPIDTRQPFMAANVGFLHMVYFWLAAGGGAAEAEQLAEGARKHLGAIPGVLRLETGFPAGTPRGVVDNSYGVALLV